MGSLYYGASVLLFYRPFNCLIAPYLFYFILFRRCRPSRMGGGSSRPSTVWSTYNTYYIQYVQRSARHGISAVAIIRSNGSFGFSEVSITTCENLYVHTYESSSPTLPLSLACLVPIYPGTSKPRTHSTLLSTLVSRSIPDLLFCYSRSSLLSLLFSTLHSQHALSAFHTIFSLPLTILGLSSYLPSNWP